MKNRIKHVKNMAYRTYRGEIWGYIIQKWKNDRITRFVLRNFEYLFARKFLPTIRRTVFIDNSVDIFKRKYDKNLTPYIHYFQGLTPDNRESYLNKKRLFNWSQYSKNSEFMCYLQPSFNNKFIKVINFSLKKSSLRNFYFSFFSKKNLKVSGSPIPRSKMLVDKWYRYDPTFLRLQKPNYMYAKTSAWWKWRILERRMAFFYGIFNLKKYRVMQRVAFYVSRLRLSSILRFEGLLCVVLFRTNLFNSMYYIHNFIKTGGVLINNKAVYNPYYRVRLLDDVSISKKYFLKIFNQFWLKLKSHRLLVNTPKYFYSNYKILTFTLWRYPLRSEIIGPYDFPFKNTSYDFSTSHKHVLS